MSGKGVVVGCDSRGDYCDIDDQDGDRACVTNRRFRQQPLPRRPTPVVRRSASVVQHLAARSVRQMAMHIQGNDSLNSFPTQNQSSSQLRKSNSFPSNHHTSYNVRRREHNRDHSKFRPQTIEMDLTFITERIISMSFPMTGMDDSYRNSLLEVTKMLRTKHGEHFMIFNLSERRNDMSQLTRQLMEFGWPDPLAPPLERLCSICKAIDSWLQLEPLHVAVLHCKGGRERIAVVVAAYMHYTSICASADQALSRFAMKKFYNDKLGGLVTPSHKRYVNYFNGLLSGAIKINSNPLYLHQIILHGVPSFELHGGCRLFVKVYQALKPVFTSGVYNVTSNIRTVTISLESPVLLRGDILVKGYNRRAHPDGRELIFRCQFHTCAVSEYCLSFNKEDLDDAGYDHRFPENGCLEFKFSPSAERHYVGIKDVSIPVDNSPDGVVRCDSYENLDLIQEENPYDTAYIINPRGNVNHTVGPLDGNPYATVAKKNGKESGLCNGGPHTASTDSGISSTTPPHSGRSVGSSVGGGPAISSDKNQVLNGNNINSTFETHAEIHRSAHQQPQQRPVPSSEEQRKLDELLDGMLAQVEKIPDLQSQSTMTGRPAFSAAPTQSTERGTGAVVVKRVTYSPELNIGGVDQGIEEDIAEKDYPYHARQDSQPFSYLVPGSSPRTARRFHPAGSTTTTTTTVAINRKKGSSSEAAEPRSVSPLLQQSTLPIAEKYVVQYNGDPAYDSEPISSLYSNGDPNHWLRRQQEKLRERKEEKYRQERNPKERQLFHELRCAQSRLPRPPDSSDSSSPDDDAPDGVTAEHQKPLYVNTYVNGHSGGHTRQQQSVSSSKGKPVSPPPSGKPPIHGRGSSAPNSPLIPSRSSSRDATRSRYPTWQGQGPGTGYAVPPPSKPLVRQRSDSSYDRPFVAVKKAHELNQSLPRKPGTDPYAAISSTPIYQNTMAYRKARMPNGSDVTSPGSPPLQSRSIGLLTTVDQPRTSSPISGHLDELEFTLHSVGTQRRSPVHVCSSSGDHDTFGTPNWSTSGDNNSPSQGDRPPTPGFPVLLRTPYGNQEGTPQSGLPPRSPTLSRKDRSPSPSTIQQIRAGFQPSDSRPNTANGGQSSPTVYFGQSRRSSLVSLTEPSEVIHHHPMFVKDTSRYWYKPNISREDAIHILKDKTPGTFLVRDSNSFPGAYGLALKVSSPPPNVQNKSGDISNELVRHFLIEPTTKGVKLKGCSNEPVFGTLSALVYQHSITPLALPCKLILPEIDPALEEVIDGNSHVQTSQLLAQGAACNVLYLFTLDMESLTGPQAIRKTTAALLGKRPLPEATVVHFKVSSQGITLTDSNRKLFFRKHYPVNSITHCGTDPDDRRWTRPTEDTGVPVTSNRIFGFIARKPASNTDNQCHLFAELEPEQPATAIVNFVTKVMMSGPNNSRAAII